MAPLPQERLRTPLRIALLTNFVPPYRIPVFQEIARRVASFRVFVSTLMEANRHWAVDFGGLEVVVQRNLTLRRRWRHPSGFEETMYLHFPWDTLWQLLRYRPDVVVSGEFGFRTLNAVIYKLLSRSKLVIWATISESSEAKREKIRLFLRAFMLRLADAVVTNGTSGARYLAGHGANPDKIFVVPQTTDIRAFADVTSGTGAASQPHSHLCRAAGSQKRSAALPSIPRQVVRRSSGREGRVSPLRRGK